MLGIPGKLGLFQKLKIKKIVTAFV